MGRMPSPYINMYNLIHEVSREQINFRYEMINQECKYVNIALGMGHFGKYN